MARLEKQESAKYYWWLFKIERTEFKKELLEIVSILSIYLLSLSQPVVQILKVLLIGTKYHKLPLGFQMDIVYTRWGGTDYNKL